MFCLSADLSTYVDCAKSAPYVALSSAEYQSLSGTGLQYPSLTDFSAAWAWGFTLVVGCYLIGWAAGAVLRFIRS